jgi:hypothetical protein
MVRLRRTGTEGREPTTSTAQPPAELAAGNENRLLVAQFRCWVLDLRRVIDGGAAVSRVLLSGTANAMGRCRAPCRESSVAKAKSKTEQAPRAGAELPRRAACGRSTCSLVPQSGHVAGSSTLKGLVAPC